jgi:menaquinone-dependent protoporphyrinogen oxidase
MGSRILVAYGTRAGSTQEIAEAVADVLRDGGAEVDVLDVKRIYAVSPYQSVVIGSAVRIGQLIPETIQFARRFQPELSTRPVAYFVVCVTMAADTLENRTTASGFLEPLRAIQYPVSVGLFAGKVDHTRVEPLWRFLLSFVKEGPMVDADHRDWNAVRAWARELVPLLVESAVETVSG